jgi:excinuclease UvrABC nuclease subunit
METADSIAMSSPEPTTAPRGRQLRLFSVENPLGTRIGADFFRNLPTKPGVYFFYDATDRLLYVGQSNDLRARVGSYRHVTPERHPKRTLRLVHRITRIEWRECATHAEAIELERVLLLEKRPPFNRAGVWPGYAWWLTVAAAEDHLEVRLSRQATTHNGCIGPLPSAFRHVHGSLMRCTFRLLHPAHHLAQYPLGLLNFAIPLQFRLGTPQAPRIARALSDFATGRGAEYVAELQGIMEGAPPLELEYWSAELDVLHKFTAKVRPSPDPALPYPVSASLPLFPEL